MTENGPVIGEDWKPNGATRGLERDDPREGAVKVPGPAVTRPRAAPEPAVGVQRMSYRELRRQGANEPRGEIAPEPPQARHDREEAARLHAETLVETPVVLVAQIERIGKPSEVRADVAEVAYETANQRQARLWREHLNKSE